MGKLKFIGIENINVSNRIPEENIAVVEVFVEEIRAINI